jgi:hypothetical protein
LFIVLNPSISAFETELCNLIAEDKSAFERVQVDPGLMFIKERRLKVLLLILRKHKSNIVYS